MRYANDVIIPTTAVATTEVVSSEWVPASSVFNVSAQIVTTGSNPNGAFKLQFSNDDPSTGLAPSNASDVTSATVSTTTSGVYAIQKTEICAMWIRFVYTNASGSGFIAARFKTNGY